ncbi:MAG TPA: hypothetical protein VFQ53_13285 [Kofleriaceae bacterium]|nr:hypothetical protein [Kofleriaceae bacterium]
MKLRFEPTFSRRGVFELAEREIAVQFDDGLADILEIDPARGRALIERVRALVGEPVEDYARDGASATLDGEPVPTRAIAIVLDALRELPWQPEVRRELALLARTAS